MKLLHLCLLLLMVSHLKGGFWSRKDGQHKCLNKNLIIHIQSTDVLWPWAKFSQILRYLDGILYL